MRKCSQRYSGRGPALQQSKVANTLTPTTEYCQQHFKSSFLDTYADGANITAWTNQAPGATNYSFKAVTNYPIKQTVTKQGKTYSVARFNNVGTAKLYKDGTAGNQAEPSTAGADLHVFLLYLPAATATDKSSVLMCPGGSVATYAHSVGTVKFASSYNYYPGFVVNGDGIVITANKPYLIEFARTGTTMTSWVNGVQTYAGTSTNKMSDNISPLTLGYDAALTFRGDCDVVELIAYTNVLDATQRNVTLAYLQSKYNYQNI